MLSHAEGGREEELTEFTCVSLHLCVLVCACTSTRALYSLLYCCLSLKQKLSGADRLAASLITILSSSSPPQTRSLLIFHKWIVPLFRVRLTVFTSIQIKCNFSYFKTTCGLARVSQMKKRRHEGALDHINIHFKMLLNELKLDWFRIET